jgi:diguanylate cyclase (GGDEF)-like protein
MSSASVNNSPQPAAAKNAAAHDAFMGRLGAALNAAGSDGVVSVGLFDIDWFGKVNDAHGREAGDSVIADLASHLETAVSNGGSVHRYGGDAFAALLPGVEKEEAFLLLEQARASFAEPRVVAAGDRGVELQVGVSAGVASSPDDSRNKVCLAREERMVTKTSHYAQGQLYGLSRLAKRKDVGEAVLLREALDDLLRKYNS